MCAQASHVSSGSFDIWSVYLIKFILPGMNGVDQTTAETPKREVYIIGLLQGDSAVG